MNQLHISCLLKQQKNRQWDFFLQSFARVFSNQLSSEDLRDLMRSIGEEAAKEITLDNAGTLSDLQTLINCFWEEKQWGCVHFEERDDYLLIQHFFSPLSITFNEEDLVWASGFLEGLYQHIFYRLGAASDLQVQSVDLEKEECLSFHLSS